MVWFGALLLSNNKKLSTRLVELAFSCVCFFCFMFLRSNFWQTKGSKCYLNVSGGPKEKLSVGIISNLIITILLNLTQLFKNVSNQIVNYQIQNHWTIQLLENDVHKFDVPGLSMVHNDILITMTQFKDIVMLTSWSLLTHLTIQWIFFLMS